MRRLRHALLAAAVAACLAPMAQAAEDPLTDAIERAFTFRPGGAQPTPPGVFHGGACPAPGTAAAEHVWWGRFAGIRFNASPGGDEGNGGAGHGGGTHSDEACFPSKAACRAWMASLLDRFGDRQIHNDCRLGYVPGAPTLPWWDMRNYR